MKYFVTAGVNARLYTELHIEASSEAEAKKQFMKLANFHGNRSRIDWEIANIHLDSLEIFADSDKEVQS